MSFLTFLETKIISFLSLIILSIFLSIFFIFTGSDVSIIVFFLFFYYVIILLKYFFEYYFQKKTANKILTQLDLLETKYYISEVIEKPKNLENLAYFTALKKTCKSIQEELMEAKKLQSDYEKFLLSFVHDIKTPIHAISLMAQNDHNQKVLNQVRDMNNLVEQIMYYARIKKSSQDYFITEVSLSSVFQEVLFHFKSQIEELKIHLNVVDIDETLFTDEKWLTFLLQQILMNAIQYLDKKEKKIDIFCRKETHAISLHIKDNGCGISKSDLPRIFEKGFTGSNRRKKYSSGMGLYLVSESVRELGLDMKINSKINIGTEVIFKFPIGEAKLMK